MKQLEFIRNAILKNVDTALVYYNLGLASNTKEEQRKCYNEAIKIYKRCKIENASTALAYYNLGLASNTKEEQKKVLQ